MDENWRKAVAQLEARLASDPNDVRAMLTLGDLYLNANRIEPAVAMYEKAARHYADANFPLKALAVYKQINMLIQKHPFLADRRAELRERQTEVEARLSLPVWPSPSVEDAFQQFKTGIARQISDGDSATHLDLGVAYKEMGLLEDARHELEIAARDPARARPSLWHIALISRRLENHAAAIHELLQALDASGHADFEACILYELGDACERTGDRLGAFRYFRRTAGIDPEYPDTRGSVKQRIAKLKR